MTHRNKYNKQINLMAADMDLNGELPSMYCDEFKTAVAALLLEEKEKSKNTFGYLQFTCLVDNFRKNGEIFELVAQYLKYDEEDESKTVIAIKIADALASGALLYHREDIEEQVQTLYRRKYQNEIYCDSLDQMTHSI